MAEQVGKFLTELPELETPTDGDLMYIVDDETTSKKVTMANLKRVLGGNVTGTVEGASVSFSDGADGIPMEECEVTLVPTQDLHGYSKPWAGGAGKNKCDTSNMSTATVSGVTFNRADDGIITVGGQATATVYKQLVNFTTENGVSYILTGCPEGGSSSKYRLTLAGYGYDYGSGLNFTGDGNSHALLLDVFTGYPTEPLEFKPMIRESTAPSGYEPYSNICPISGHTDVTVTVASTSGGSGDDTTVSLGRTVYGGTLDVTTGELIVTHGIVDLGTLTWIKQTDTSNYVVFTQASPVLSRAYNYNFICTQYATAQKTRQELLNGEIGTSNAALSNICIRDDSKEDMTAEQFKTAMDGVMLVYELATPQTYNLTPTQVETLLGQNYVSHDGGGNIKVVYIRDLDITINDLIDRVTALENE